ncbi:hypothetical protein DSOL_0007 [Desulfosporosinus metallidurans]|uniref:Uncharacterized protein n=1 Tax=Desulfosporosinus metallidurans TaxID=1888891 RepID=A0A1Q8R2L8_9FIRM|nr:hypothetical protein DSOL_0007 [Desulfosporosinus metallidurans]
MINFLEKLTSPPSFLSPSASEATEQGKQKKQLVAVGRMPIFCDRQMGEKSQ